MRTGRRIQYMRKTFKSKLRIMLSLFEISKGERAPDCSRAKGAKARDDKWKEGEAERGKEICMLPFF